MGGVTSATPTPDSMPETPVKQNIRMVTLFPKERRHTAETLTEKEGHIYALYSLTFTETEFHISAMLIMAVFSHGKRFFVSAPSG